ncbi:MAG: hypothetical protein HQ548_07315, partial [Chloroflexi bacterium]|nr:hypothetical protein [Chloroflexota bacterium]
MSRRLLSRYLLRGALAVAAVATLLVASVLLGQQAVASADEGSRGSSAHLQPTHVVLKLTPEADIDGLLAAVNAARYSAVLERSFDGTTIHVIRVTTGEPTVLTSVLQRDSRVVWAERGVFAPTVEGEGFSQTSFEQFSAAAFEQFSAAAFEQFSAAAFEQFSAAAFEQFSAAAYE